MYVVMSIVAVILALLLLFYMAGRPKKRTRSASKKAVLSQDRKDRPANAYWSGNEWLQERRSGGDRRAGADRRRSIRLEDERRSGYDRRKDISAWGTAQ